MRRLMLSLTLLCACPSTAITTGFPQVTGVRVPAEAIVPAAQCGTGAAQIAKYTAVLSTDGAIVAGQTYDCFTDAVFVNLPTGSISVAIEVFGWTQATYAARRTEIDEAANIQLLLAAQPPDTARVDAIVTGLRSVPSAVKKACTATRRDNVQTVAVCAPADAGLADGSSDAPAEAEPADAADSGAADGPDGG